MISSTEIIFAMSTDDMSNKTLHNRISKYKDICKSDVDEIIRIGVVGYLKPYGRLVAWLLNLKKYVPAGYAPRERVIPVKERLDLPVCRTMDMFNPSSHKGDNHYKRKNAQPTIPVLTQSEKHKEMAKANRKWTEDDLAILENLYRAGLSPAEISQILPRTIAAIQTKLSTKGLSNVK